MTGRITALEYSIKAQGYNESSNLSVKNANPFFRTRLPDKNADSDAKSAFFLFVLKALFYGLFLPFPQNIRYGAAAQPCCRYALCRWALPYQKKKSEETF